MCQNWKKIAIIALLALPLIMIGGFRGDAQAGEKNPCGKNPCAMKNPCAAKNPCSMKNPCGMKNPCAMKPKPIRKTAITDNAKLIEMGEKLWNDTKLGTSGAACVLCHPHGKGLKKVPFPKYLKMPDDILTLDQMINFCMENPMKGKPLAWNSVEITALAAYVQSHAKEEGEPANPCAAKNPCGMKNPCGIKNPCGKR
ncbi:MAG TPA: cytochrome C peroxidase [Thermodesulfobacteriota bacterium]|nr:cytochrome C peroxidase [Thermodesulfobacteriota bacterium]